MIVYVLCEGRALVVLHLLASHRFSVHEVPNGCNMRRSGAELAEDTLDGDGGGLLGERLQVGAHEARRALRDELEVEVAGQPQPARQHLSQHCKSRSQDASIC